MEDVTCKGNCVSPFFLGLNIKDVQVVAYFLACNFFSRYKRKGLGQSSYLRALSIFEIAIALKTNSTGDGWIPARPIIPLPCSLSTQLRGSPRRPLFRRVDKMRHLSVKEKG